jgi:Protein of unknown function (DUF2806)
MADTNAIVNFGDLSKPADTLITKVSEAVGGLFRPYQIKRIAQAEAAAALIKAETEVAVSELQRRGLSRLVAEETRRQRNMESITTQAITQLKTSAEPAKLDDDWITNFFEKCRIVSDQEMQALWAKVLAGEANAPGRYSKRTVNLLGNLDRLDANAFSRLARFFWIIGDVQPLVLDLDAPIYKEAEINFALLSHLDDIGLVSFSHLTGYVRRGFPERATVTYFGTDVSLGFSQNGDLQVGKVMLTMTGQQLAPLCVAEPVAGLIDYVVAKWGENGVFRAGQSGGF